MFTWQSVECTHTEAFLFSWHYSSSKNKWLSNHWSEPRLQNTPSYTTKSRLIDWNLLQVHFLMFKNEHPFVWSDASATEGQVSKCCSWGDRGSSTRCSSYCNQESPGHLRQVWTRTCSSCHTDRFQNLQSGTRAGTRLPRKLQNHQDQ